MYKKNHTAVADNTEKTNQCYVTYITMTYNYFTGCYDIVDPL